MSSKFYLSFFKIRFFVQKLAKSFWEKYLTHWVFGSTFFPIFPFFQKVTLFLISSSLIVWCRSEMAEQRLWDAFRAYPRVVREAYQDDEAKYIKHLQFLKVKSIFIFSFLRLVQRFSLQLFIFVLGNISCVVGTFFSKSIIYLLATNIGLIPHNRDVKFNKTCKGGVSSFFFHFLFRFWPQSRRNSFCLFGCRHLGYSECPWLLFCPHQPLCLLQVPGKAAQSVLVGKLRSWIIFLGLNEMFSCWSLWFSCRFIINNIIFKKIFGA